MQSMLFVSSIAVQVKPRNTKRCVNAWRADDGSRTALGKLLLAFGYQEDEDLPDTQNLNDRIEGTRPARNENVQGVYGPRSSGRRTQSYSFSTQLYFFLF